MRMQRITEKKFYSRKKYCIFVVISRDLFVLFFLSITKVSPGEGCQEGEGQLRVRRQRHLLLGVIRDTRLGPEQLFVITSYSIFYAILC